MAATNYTPIQLYYSTTASAAPTAGNLVNGELAINITDGKLYYKDNGGNVQVIATKGAGTIGGSNTQIQFNDGGALAGNAAMVFNKSTNVTTLTTLNLTNALGATYGGTAQSAYAQGDILYASATNTLSKLTIGTVNYILTSTGSVPQWVAPTSVTVQTANNLAGGAAGSVPYQSSASTTTFLSIGSANTVMTSSGTGPQWVTALTGLTGVSSSSITNTSLTSGRLVYSTTGGAQTDSANLTFNGTTLSTTGFSNTGFETIVKTTTIGNSNFNGSAVFAPTTPAKLYIGTGTVTDVTSAASATNTTGAITAFGITPIAASNTSVTYTNASTLYIAGAPTAGTNITITNPYAFYVAGGASYFGGAVDFAVTPSYSGGTANGVMYLNGSKQITTGAVLVFDGTNLKLGTTSSTNKLLIDTAVSNAGTIQLPRGSFIGFSNAADNANSEYVYANGGALEFGINGSTALNLSSTGNLDVIGTADTTLTVRSSAGAYTSILKLQAAGGGGSVINATGATSNILVFQLAASEKARLNTTGFGIGTNSPLTLLDVRGGYITAGTASSVAGTKVLGGYYTNGNIATWGTEYSNGSPVMGYGVWPSTSASGAFVSSTGITVARGAYSIVGNQHFWYSGGAQTVAVDGAVSTSVIGKFDDSGNFLVGTTNNYSVGAANWVMSKSGYVFAADNTGSANNRNWLMNVNGSAAGSLDFVNSSANNTWPNAAYIMSLTRQNNVLIGTTTDQGRRLIVSGTFALVDSALNTIADIAASSTGELSIRPYYGPGSTITFGTNPNGGGVAERGRFDLSGNFLLGTTTARNRLTVQGTVYSTPTLGTASGNAFFGEAAGYGMMLGTSGFGYGWIQQQRVDGSATAYALILQPVGGSVYVNRTGAQNNGKLEVLADSGAQAIVAQVQSNGNSLFQGFSSSGGSAVFQVTGNGALGTNTIDLYQGALTFPATQVASSNPNTLDDYEEGTWSPTLLYGSAPSVINEAKYIKIGQFVFCNIDVTLATQTNSNPCLISLPFSWGSNWSAGSFNYNSVSNTLTINGDSGYGAYVGFRSSPVAGNISVTELSGARLIFTFSYRSST